MRHTPLWDAIETRLIELLENEWMEVPERTMATAFEQFPDYDLPTSLGLSMNQMLMLGGNRPMPSPEKELEQLCERHKITIKRPNELGRHWAFIKREKVNT